LLYTKHMHVFFSGIGGTGIGPLALIAKQAGFEVSGSDKQDSSYIEYLRDQGIVDIHIGQSKEAIEEVHEANPIDWYVYSAAVAIEQPDAPEFNFCRNHDIRLSLRDELINLILEEKQLQLIAIAGTHGKTTTTAMVIWAMRQLGIPVSYSVGAKIPFGDMGHYEPGSQYFVYEADEFARNFLAFSPTLSLITGIDWDHPDIYPTRESYNEAFKDFLGQSHRSIMWQNDVNTLELSPSMRRLVLKPEEPAIDTYIRLAGHVNRLNAWEAAQAIVLQFGFDINQVLSILNSFPGVSRRFEQITGRLYSDYAHTPPKIRGAIQIAQELDRDNIVVIYEGLHNTRQHFIREELNNLFDDVKKVYIVPTYLAREDPNLELLTPEKLCLALSPDAKLKSEPAELNDSLKSKITEHLNANDIVLCLSAGGGNSLDEWLREQFKPLDTH
jgi:UDP-N-acetylmuramate--alanine ligase